MKGILYIVGTPIGNLKDITYRAVEVLGAVDLIACEDTRVTQVLLSHYGIKKPLTSYYKHKEREGTEKLLDELLSGKNVALVTDAGMPAISDPGAILVESARRAGVTVTVVPGATAVASAVALSGVQSKGFTFLGFLPEKNKDKEEFIAPFVFSPLPLVFYCSPHSVNDDAAFLYNALGNRKVYVIKEITKMFERVEETELSSMKIENPRGEFVIIVEGAIGESPLNTLTVKEHVQHYMQSGLSKKDSIKRTAADRGVDKNSVYVEVLDV
jgi:probable S-adenosylmethionine-dependent methyltransferase, YraL family